MFNGQEMTGVYICGRGHNLDKGVFTENKNKDLSWAQ